MSCASTKLVERHFAGRIAPEDERTLRAHLPECGACSRLYARHLVLARLDPGAPSAEERLGRGLGLLPRRARTRQAWLGAPMLALAALALFLLVRPRGGADADDFVARGRGPVETAQLQVYALHEGAAATPVHDLIHAGDELAFAYANPDGRAQLMVFAVDEAGRVYWYVPAWTDPAADPRSLPLARGTELREVGDAVRHDFAGRRLTLHALFTDEAYSVRQIEAMLAIDPAALDQLGRPHVRLSLEVAP